MSVHWPPNTAGTADTVYTPPLRIVIGKDGQCGWPPGYLRFSLQYLEKCRRVHARKHPKEDPVAEVLKQSRLQETCVTCGCCGAELKVRVSDAKYWYRECDNFAFECPGCEQEFVVFRPMEWRIQTTAKGEAFKP